MVDVVDYSIVDDCCCWLLIVDVLSFMHSLTHSFIHSPTARSKAPLTNPHKKSRPTQLTAARVVVIIVIGIVIVIVVIVIGTCYRHGSCCYCPCHCHCHLIVIVIGVVRVVIVIAVIVIVTVVLDVTVWQQSRTEILFQPSMASP